VLPTNQPIAVYVAAIDIVGFSRLLESPDALSNARIKLFQAVESTVLFPKMVAEKLFAHFLGDELRFAFPADGTNAGEVRQFVLQVIDSLRARTSAPEVCAVVVAGRAILQNRLDCTFLEGPVAFKAQRWLSTKIVRPGEVCTDEGFGEPPAHDWSPRRVGNDDGWVHQ
jgi:hypothetical protein